MKYTTAWKALVSLTHGKRYRGLDKKPDARRVLTEAIIAHQWDHFNHLIGAIELLLTEWDSAKDQRIAEERARAAMKEALGTMDYWDDKGIL